jgi:hypothetical protein
MSFNELHIGGPRLRAGISGYTLKTFLQIADKALVTYLLTIEVIYRLHIQYPKYFTSSSSDLVD